MKYFSLKYLIKTLLGILSIAACAKSNQITYSNLTSSCIPVSCYDNMLDYGCDQCNYCNNVDGIYAPAAQSLNVTAEQQYNNTYTYIYMEKHLEEDKVLYTPHKEEYICVPWNMIDCNSVPQVSDSQVESRTRVYTYTSNNNKYIPMSITYSQYESAFTTDYNMDIYSVLPTILKYNQSSNINHTVQTDYIIPLRLYIGETYNSQDHPLDQASVISSSICQGQQICYKIALEYLLDKNLCWPKAKFDCIKKYAVTGQQLLGSKYHNHITVSPEQLLLYSRYYNTPRFLPLDCNIPDKNFSYVEHVIQRSHILSINDSLIQKFTIPFLQTSQTSTQQSITSLTTSVNNIINTVSTEVTPNIKLIPIVLFSILGSILSLLAIIGCITYKYIRSTLQVIIPNSIQNTIAQTQNTSIEQEQRQSFIRPISVQMSEQGDIRSDSIRADNTVDISV